MTEFEVEEIVTRVVEATVSNMLMRLGIDTNDPQAFIEFRKDLTHNRGWRIATETVKEKGLGAAVTVLVTGAIGYIIYLATGGKIQL